LPVTSHHSSTAQSSAARLKQQQDEKDNEEMINGLMTGALDPKNATDSQIMNAGNELQKKRDAAADEFRAEVQSGLL
jgi:hypothetical protein